MKNKEVVRQLKRGIRISPFVIGPSNTLMSIHVPSLTRMARIMPILLRLDSRGEASLGYARGVGILSNSRLASHILCPLAPAYLAQ